MRYVNLSQNHTISSFPGEYILPIALFVMFLVFLLILIFSAQVAFSVGTGTDSDPPALPPSLQTEKLKVGDTMPDYKQGTVKWVENSYHISESLQIWHIGYKDKETQKQKWTVVHRTCDGVLVTIPYGVFHSPTKVLYLDNNGMPDGIIDEVVEDPKRIRRTPLDDVQSTKCPAQAGQ